MEKLEKRINKIINTKFFENALKEHNIDLFEFQLSWNKFGEFQNLPESYKQAILAGEKELLSIS